MTDPTRTIVEPVRIVTEVFIGADRVVSVCEPTPTAPVDLGGLVSEAELDAVVTELMAQITAPSLRVLNPAFVFVQALNSRFWRIAHNLGYNPAGITIIDTTGETVECELTYLDTTTLQLGFAAPTAGTAYLS